MPAQFRQNNMDAVYRIAISFNNSPWGVIKHPTKGNVYKHVLRFNDAVLRNNYINERLFKGLNYKDLLKENATIPSHFPVMFGNETTFYFRVGLSNYKGKDQSFAPKNIDELANRDFCAVKKPHDDRYYFYTLEAQEMKQGFVYFKADLDIFFTYNLDDKLLSSTRKSFVNQGHIKRFNDDGSPNWDKILKNDGLPVAANKTIGVNTVKSSDLQRTSKEIRALVYYINTEFLTKEATDPKNDGELIKYVKEKYKNNAAERDKAITAVKALKTDYNNLGLPYIAFVVPFQTPGGYDKIEAWESGGTDTNLYPFEIAFFESLRTQQGDKSNIYAIHNKEFSALGLDLDPEELYIYDNNDKTKVIFRFKKPTDLFALPGFKYLQAGGKFFFVITDIAKLWKTEAPKLTFTAQNIGKAVKKHTNYDPIIYHPEVYHFNLRKWNSTEKQYFLPYLKLNADNTLNVYSLYSYQPESDNNVVWMEHEDNYKNSLMEGDTHTIENTASLITSQDKYLEYRRDNKNAFDLSHKQAQARADYEITQAGLNLGSISGAGLGGIIQSGLELNETIQRKNRLNDMRAATIKDWQNRPPNVNIINNGINDMGLGRLTGKTGELVAVERGLLPEHEKMLLDYVKQYGYQVSTFENILSFIKTRRKYNYIEATDVFNDIIMNLSAPIKQAFNDAFASGLYIWHIRSIGDTIKNFDGLNDETDLAKRKKREAEEEEDDKEILQEGQERRQRDD